MCNQQLVVIIIENCLFTVAQSCDHGDIRLSDGPTMFEGRVEVCVDDEWVTVCNDFWGHNEMAVVCRQLGFSTTGEILRVKQPNSTLT